MKQFLIFAVLLSLGLCSNMPHDYNDCPDPTKAATMVFEKQVQRAGRWFSIIEDTISFPEVGVNKDPITCIMVKDLAKDGKGGYATVDGNVGGYNLKIKLRSQVGQGLHFSVAVYT
ncbi:probable salivary secreted peptide [Harmonia axyridis]|uniref:probable salivary secreted peptide n=1 Tax=Harmonia axyridis TaxID=115357 RepID=UPI001E27555C|nr:probable salivary secreted peptide [Harmonia axyridis]